MIKEFIKGFWNRLLRDKRGTRVKGSVNPYPFSGYPPELKRTTKNVNVGVTPTLLLAQRLKRVVFMIYNNSQVTVYVGDSGVTIANGIPIQRGGSYTNEGFGGVVYGIIAALPVADCRIEEN